MATLEHEQPLAAGRAEPARDPHVFAAATGRRAHALRLAGACIGLLSLAWLGALGVALLGAGTLPAGLPAAKARAAAPAAAPAHVVRAVLVRRAPAAPGLSAPAPSRAAVPTARPVRNAAPASTTVAPARAPVAPPAVIPPAPPTPRQGWARRGWTAPPGQARQDQPPGQSASHARNPH